jgi:hypothetical protein
LVPGDQGGIKGIGNGDIYRIGTSQAMLYSDFCGPPCQRMIKGKQLYS